MSGKKICGLVLAMFFTAVACYAGEMVKGDAAKYYNEGVKAQKSGDMENAKTAYQKAMILSEGTRKDITKSIYNNYGLMYVNQENLELAGKFFGEALKIDPDYKEANFNMGILSAKIGEAEKALMYWSKALNKTSSYILEGEKPE